MLKIAVCLSGCGVYDGSEIHESVCTLLALDEAGAEAVCYAPDIAQMHVVNHAAGAPEDGAARGVLAESARIARGKITSLAAFNAEDADALIFPGGFGAAKNLCTFAVDGAACKVDAQVERVVKAMHAAKKPVGAMCIAPAVLARVLGGMGVKARLTIGNDSGTAAAINAMGCEHVECAVEGCVVDAANRIVTTPAYMYDPGIAAVNKGIRRLVEEVLKMAETN